MNITALIISFIGTQLVGGRKVSIPWGVAQGMGFFPVVFLSFALDLIFVPIVYFLYGSVFFRRGFIAKIRRFIIGRQERSKGGKIFKWFKHLGKTGVALAPAIPFTGGINLSIPLAYMLNLRHRDGILLISLGNLLGCLLIALLSKGLVLATGN